MALLWYDGFDNYNSTTDMASQISNVISYLSLLGSIQAPGRGGFGKMINNCNYVNMSVNTSSNIIIVGGAFANISNPGYQALGGCYIQFQDFSGAMLKVYFSTEYEQIIITSNGVTLYTSPSAFWNKAAFNFFEIYVVFSATAGQVKVQINGELVINLQNVDTLPTGTSNFNYLSISGADGNSLFSIDDLYICDGTTGPGTYPNNNFLGDVRCATLFPVGNGVVQWTPLANTNWQEVSETAMDGDTSYNFSDTAGQQDLFNFAALTGVIDQIVAVQIKGAYRKSDAGTRVLQQQLLSGTTQSGGAQTYFGLSYAYVTDTYPNDPNTGVGWTLAAVNALQAGYKLIS
jgi:hypothetical protein